MLEAQKKHIARWWVPAVLGLVGVWVFGAVFSEIRVSHAYLVKMGPEYVVAWYGLKESEGTPTRAFRFQTLEQASSFLWRLRLVPAESHPRSGRLGLQRLWQTPKGKGATLQWNTRASNFTHRLTFASREEAAFFFRAFDRGAYSTSVFGHAIRFQPLR